MRKTSVNIIKRFSTLLVALTCLLTWQSPCQAITLKEEKELSREFMKVVHRYYDLIDDPIITAYVNQIGQKILQTMPQQPFAYKFHVIKEGVYNAFAIPAGYIFINSGLLLAMESEDELAGIFAHEISHVTSRHISQRIERSKKIDLASMAGLVAGIFLGTAVGSPEAAQALTYGSLAAGQTLTLAYSREDEAQADHVGLAYLNKAGYSAEGLLIILKKIRSKQWFGSNQIPTYVTTHPAVEERIAAIDSWMSTHTSDSRQVHSSKDLTRVQIRLRALYEDPDATIQLFETGLKSDPANADYVYGLGLCYTRKKRYKEAVTYLQEALTHNALDPVILSDLGKVYFLEGRPKDALPLLEGATSLNGLNIEGLFYLGRTYMTLGDYASAVDSLEKVLQKHESYTQAYYYLGEAYGKLDQSAEMHYYLGFYHYYRGDARTAHYHLIRAQREIKNPTKQQRIKQVLDSLKIEPEPNNQDE